MTTLATNAYAAIAAWFPAYELWQLMGVLFAAAVITTVANAGLNYVGTMVIEQKYGFNRTTMKTFVFDQLRTLLVEAGLSVGMMWLLMALHQAMGDWVVLVFTGAVFCFTLLMSFLYPFFSRMGNKFVPLEDGELKDKLMALLTKHGYKVRAIEVMDASRRTTKLNAYFTGFGKMKTIVLYDNMLTAMSTDEIIAVFAHELGHGLHKDVLKMQIMNLGNLLLMAVLVWLTVKIPEMHTAFGFAGVNYGFSYILLSIGLGVIQPFTGILTNAYSRKAEYRADRQAVQEGYGAALATALKKLSKENFSHLAPSKLLVVLYYSHPPLSERIAAIEQAMQEVK
jgi:STE24 endopeptidase